MTFSCSTGAGQAPNGTTLIRMSGASTSAPLLVLGPSLGTAVETLWGEVAATLADSFQVVGWELPGHGRGAATDTAFTVEDLADRLIDAVEDLCGARQFTYAGDSIGGAVGLALLLRHRQAITGAALACTGARIGSETMWLERADLVRASGTDAVVDGSRARWFAPGFTDHSPAVTHAMLQQLREVDDESYALTCGALASFDVRDQLGSIDAPVTVIAGADDVATPVADGQLIVDAVPGAQLHVLEHVGHLAPVEAPAQVAELVRASTHATRAVHAHG